MRGLGPLLSCLLVSSVLAGCVGGQDEDVRSSGGLALTPIDASSVQVPAGAELSLIDHGVRLTWADVELPLEVGIEVPLGTTVVRTRGTLADGGPLGTAVESALSGSPRCETPEALAWDAGRDTYECVGLTALDPMPARWTLLAATFTSLLGEPARGTVEMDYLSVPLDGVVGQLDLSLLSMPEFAERPTEVFKVESHDGALLHVEVTLPDAEGPFPTFLVSSPYNQPGRLLGARAGDFYVREWVPRGYAVVSADVRGYGESGGCVEVWGPNEQKDQAVLVDWIAAQPWSDGTVGFHGVSYVGTTPVEAAVQAPVALKAIAPVAGVINAYYDWHHGGVPNGESAASPAAYQAIGIPVQPQPMDPLATAMNMGNGLCDPTLVARANDVNAAYDEFYEERNFSARAPDVKAAVLFSQGFEDSNVKSAMALWWFNALEVPKLALVGHWAHQYAVRGDDKVLLLAWMDQYVRGRPVGFERVAPVSLTTNTDAYREAQAWPPLDAEDVRLFADLGAGTLGPDPTEGEASLLVEPTGLRAFTDAELEAVTGVLGAQRITLTYDVPADLQIAGVPKVRLAVSLEGVENALLDGRLYEVTADGEWRLITYGGSNLGLREGYDHYVPMPRGEVVAATMPFLPTDYVVRAGSKLVVEIEGTTVLSSPGALQQPGIVTLHGGDEATRLVLPTLPMATLSEAPVTVLP